MVGRVLRSRAEPGFTLPAFERLAPPPPRDVLDARIDALSEPGDVVVDLFGRGGWVARAAIDRNRRGFSLESSPLTRLLAEVVLRPPDLRHLDAAFSALSASPQGETSLRLFIADLFATSCRSCGRNVAADELEWRTPATAEGAGNAPGTDAAAGPAADARIDVLEQVHYRCPLCRDQQGRHEHQVVEPSGADRDRASRDIGANDVRRRLRERFPVPDGADHLVDAILALHTDRQLVGLAAILGRIEGELRAAPVESALRLAFLHAVLPASRLGLAGPRIPALRLAGGTVKSVPSEHWRERNPWLAFEDGFQQVRDFLQRLESNALGPLEARLTGDLRSLTEGAGNAVVRVMTPDALPTLAREPAPPIRLVLGQPPARFSQERLGAAYHGTCWALGREAAALLPLEPLLGPAVRAPWSWQAAAIRRALEAVASHLARDARVVLLLEHGGPEALAAAVLGGVGAGYRLLGARQDGHDDEIGGIVELSPPGALLPPPARTRGNRPLELSPGGRGDPDVVPGPGMFAAPERIEARPFSPREAAQTVLETALEVLRARGEPASTERLLGEIFVGLDRSGQLRRLIATEAPAPSDGAAQGEDGASGDERGTTSARAAALGTDAVTPPDRPTRVRTFSSPSPPRDPVDRLLAIVTDELHRTNQGRVVEIEPGRWWLGDRRDREQAALPLADRVEWAVYSLLSTAGPMSETAFFERVAALFQGHDLPDETLVRACLASYRSPTSTPARLVTADDLRQRTAEHTELLALLANGGHRLGMRIWIGRREQARRIGNLTLGEFLDYREREPWFPTSTSVPKEDGEAIDCIWYQRGGSAFLFEVEWTAMLGDLLLRRHGRIPPDDRMVRFLAIPPERRELVRHKLDASPVLRDAVAQSNWHMILWPHLRAWLEHDPPTLADLEPYLGLEPAVERRAEQMYLFETGNSLP